MKKIHILTILSAITLILTGCAKKYESRALVEASVRGSINEKIDPLLDIDRWIAQHGINVPEGTRIVQMRQSRLLQIQSIAKDPAEAANLANKLAMDLEQINLDGTDGYVFKIVEKATPSTR